MPVQAAETVKPSKQMEQFFSFDRASQEAFIGNGIIMIAVIASQIDTKIARCIDTWYTGKSPIQNLRQSEIIQTMKKLPQYKPEAIVLAVIEKQCGKFKREKSH